ncbi:DUF2652 domain-containing protein [Sinomicrobium sp. M5D2P9]
MKNTPVLQKIRQRPYTPPNVSVVKEGTIIIPDISGFTRFVNETDSFTGKYVTQALLSSIIDSNILNLRVSEIEGDAVLFYGYGTPYDLKSVIAQYEIMLRNFNRKLVQLEVFIGSKINLSLKLIAHYGPVSEYSIGKFRKLYGKAVVQAHQLLKNSINSKTYVLLTENLLKAVPSVLKNPGKYGAHGKSEDIDYTYYNYEPIPVQGVIT